MVPDDSDDVEDKKPTVRQAAKPAPKPTAKKPAATGDVSSQGASRSLGQECGGPGSLIALFLLCESTSHGPSPMVSRLLNFSPPLVEVRKCFGCKLMNLKT